MKRQQSFVLALPTSELAVLATFISFKLFLLAFISVF